jgi:hypothetical protein
MFLQTESTTSITAPRAAKFAAILVRRMPQSIIARNATCATLTCYKIIACVGANIINTPSKITIVITYDYGRRYQESPRRYRNHGGTLHPRATLMRTPASYKLYQDLEGKLRKSLVRCESSLLDLNESKSWDGSRVHSVDL